MSALPEERPTPMTEAEYLEFERSSELKHEFLDGEIYAMSGASRAHNLICMTASFLLYSQLRGRPCETYQSDMRVKVPATGLYTYPDVTVVCGQVELADEAFDTLLNPTIIIEVLSPSTERYDRGRKFQHYRKLPSLQEYVLIAQDAPRIEHYRRGQDGTWLLTDASGLEAVVQLPAIGCTLALSEVYEQVAFTAEEQEETPQNDEET